MLKNMTEAEFKKIVLDLVDLDDRAIKHSKQATGLYLDDFALRILQLYKSGQFMELDTIKSVISYTGRYLYGSAWYTTSVYATALLLGGRYYILDQSMTPDMQTTADKDIPSHLVGIDRAEHYAIRICSYTWRRPSSVYRLAKEDTQ